MSCLLPLWTPRPASVIKIIQDCGQILYLVPFLQPCWNLLEWISVSEKKVKFDLVYLTELCFGISVFFCGLLPNLISLWLPTLMWFFLGDGIVEPKHWIIHFSSEISAAKFWESFVCWHVQWNKNHILLMGIFFLPGGTQRCLQRLTVSEYLSFIADIALKSLDFVSALIKHDLSLLHETLWQVFYLSTMLVVGVLKNWWLWSSLPLFSPVTWMKTSLSYFARH